MDLANGLKTASGRAALLAQEELLTVCDRLYTSSKVSVNQLLYLRHMVLIRDDAIASVYDNYQSHRSVTLLARHLLDIAQLKLEQQQQQTSGQQVAGDKVDGADGDAEEVYNDDEDEEGEEGEYRDAARDHFPSGEATSGTARPDAPSPMASTLNGTIAGMLRAGQITTSEAVVLLELVNAENEYVGAAYELYEQDNDEEELRDTLTRCAKLEVKKRAAASRGSKLRYQQEDSETGSGPGASGGEEGEEKDAAELGIDTSEGDGDGEGIYDDTEDDEDAEEEDEEDEGEGKEVYSEQLHRHVGALVAAMGLEDTWSGQWVPQQFLFTVLAAAHKGIFTPQQARVLCDLYQAGYDLVRASWEVYNVQADVRDFTDTLLRVVRDLELADGINGLLTPLGAPAGGVGGGKAAPLSQGTSAQRAERARVQEEVRSAKRGLLKQSLEMMVERGMTDRTRANSLLERGVKGDVLVDAAIEAYAGDKDVGEFLDTLQILASNSPEDLDAMMRAAVSGPQSGQGQGTGATASTTLNPAPVAAHVTVPSVRSPEKGKESDVKQASQGLGQGQGQGQGQRKREAEHLSSPSTSRSAPSNGVGLSTNGGEAGDNALAQRETRRVISDLLAQGRIDTVVEGVLNRLVASCDDRVMAAHDVYK